jgi:altronate hydrolase
MSDLHVINQRDNAGVNLRTGHKEALRDIPEGGDIIKYGLIIGKAIAPIKKGEHIHTNNMATNLKGKVDYTYEPDKTEIRAREPGCFLGYRRKDGQAAIRNEIWVINTVGCINSTAGRIARRAEGRKPSGIDGVYALTHPYGCSQLGEDHENTRKILAGLVRHPNAAGVLVLGLGCENNLVSEFKKEIDGYDEKRVRFLQIQDCEDEEAEASKIIDGLFETYRDEKRYEIPLSELIVGLKCGGSDGYSGITANPLAGLFSDALVSMKGTAVLTEVPEMFGAEQMLMNRCISNEVFDKCVSMINSFKDYYISHNQNIYDNPSPGNREGGITTLEEKSAGCITKGGSSPVADVIKYGERITKKGGLVLLEGPGNDMVASTALAAAGAHLVIFTTGRGTPYGTCIPTVKVSSNTGLFTRKGNWIDFDGGRMLSEDACKISEEFFKYITDVASGAIKTKNEINDMREITIFKNGVTL